MVGVSQTPTIHLPKTVRSTSLLCYLVTLLLWKGLKPCEALRYFVTLLPCYPVTLERPETVRSTSLLCYLVTLLLWKGLKLCKALRYLVTLLLCYFEKANHNYSELLITTHNRSELL